MATTGSLVYVKEITIFMCKHKDEMLLCWLDGIFIYHKFNHNYNAQNDNDYQVPMQQVNNIISITLKIWNKLLKFVKSLKKLLKLLSSWLPQVL